MPLPCPPPVCLAYMAGPAWGSWQAEGMLQQAGLSSPMFAFPWPAQLQHVPAALPMTPCPGAASALCLPLPYRTQVSRFHSALIASPAFPTKGRERTQVSRPAQGLLISSSLCLPDHSLSAFRVCRPGLILTHAARDSSQWVPGPAPSPSKGSQGPVLLPPQWGTSKAWGGGGVETNM